MFFFVYFPHSVFVTNSTDSRTPGIKGNYLSDNTEVNHTLWSLIVSATGSENARPEFDFLE